MEVPSQVIMSDTLRTKSGTLRVFADILKQINAKLEKDLYNMNFPYLKNTMIVGTDVINSGGKSIMGLCSSRTKEIS